MSSSPQELIEGSVRLSSLPEIYFKINDVINDPESSFGDVADVISNDTSLSFRLLQIVNSSFYNFPSPIDTISHAISIVGTKQLRDLALATSVLTAFEGIPEDFVSMKSFWKHSVGCGIAAWIVALNCRESNPEWYYLAGILHDVGRLIIFENHPEKAEMIVEQSLSQNRLMFEVEREILGFDHGEVGAALLDSWNLPLNLQEITGSHHRPLNESKHARETAIVSLADMFSKSMVLGTSGDRLVPQLKPEIWGKVGMDVGSIALLWNQIETQFNETIDIFIVDPK